MKSELRPLNAGVPSSAKLVAAGATTVLRTINQRVLYELLFDSGPVTRPQLARLSGLSQPTVIAALADLENAGLVKAVGHAHSAPGRAPMVFEVDPTVGVVIGVDIGREWLRLLITDLAGNRLCQLDTRNTAKGGDTMIDAVVALVHEGTEQAGVGPGAVTHTVVGSPGVYGADGQQLRFAANLPGRGRVAAGLRERLAGELTVENDANLAALGEYTYGAGQATRQFVYLTIGTGVGVGIVLDGQLYRGTSGSAGEIGHLPVGDQPTGPSRGGSWRGMLEESLGAAALVRRAKALGMPGRVSAAGIFAAARAGDAQAMDVVLAVLNNDNDLPVRTLGDGVPDSQTVGCKMDPVRLWQRVSFGKRVGKCRDWFFEQMKDCPVGGVSKWLRQRLSSFQVLSGKRRTRSLTNSPRVCQFLAGKDTAFRGV